MPIFYECQRCTACCRWPGQVRVTDAEIARLAAFKGMSEHEFIQQFTRLRQDRRGLVLQEKPDGSCVFLDGNDCSVQPVKPQQCRGFPNLWNFPGFEKICHAIPRLVNGDDMSESVERQVHEWRQQRITDLQQADGRYWREIIAELTSLCTVGKPVADGAV